MKTLKVVMIALVLYVVGTFVEGVYDGNHKDSNLLTLAMTARSKNVIGREIYKIGIHTNPHWKRQAEKVYLNLNKMSARFK